MALILFISWAYNIPAIQSCGDIRRFKWKDVSLRSTRFFLYKHLHFMQTLATIFQAFSRLNAMLFSLSSIQNHRYQSVLSWIIFCDGNTYRIKRSHRCLLRARVADAFSPPSSLREPAKFIRKPGQVYLEGGKHFLVEKIGSADIFRRKKGENFFFRQ